MFTKELIDILIKYSDENQDNIEQINKSVQQITDSLKKIKSNISKQLWVITNSDDVADDGTNILNDINKLKRSISEINSSIIVTKQYNIPYDNTDFFYEKLNVYLVPDDICPICGAKLEPYILNYKKIVEHKIKEDYIELYKCPSCNNIFALYYDVEDVDFEQTNILFNTKYLQKLSIYEDIYVFSNISKCSSNNHKIQDISCVLPIVKRDGSIDTVLVDLSYCETCNRYVMLKYTYDNLEGVPICKIIDETRESSNNSESYFDDSESKLRQYGYNVNCIDKLTEEQRHTILAAQLITKNMQRSEIISAISKNITNGEKRIAANYKKDWSNAVKKWKSDREFVNNFDIEKSYNLININRIVLKYTK